MCINTCAQLELVEFLVFSSVVFGFDILGQPLESPTFTAHESFEVYLLPVRVIKGQIQELQFVLEVLPGTAG